MEVQLQQYFKRIRDELNVTRLSHFDYVKNEDLEKIGMGRPGEGKDLCLCRSRPSSAFHTDVCLIFIVHIAMLFIFVDHSGKDGRLNSGFRAAA